MTTTSGDSWHIYDADTEVQTSYLTGHRITINLDPERFWIPTAWSPDACMALLVRIQASPQFLERTSLAYREVLQRLLAGPRTRSAFGKLFNEFQIHDSYNRGWPGPNQVKVWLWSAGCLAWPKYSPRDRRGGARILNSYFNGALTRDLDDYSEKVSSPRYELLLRRAILARHGCTSIGDLTPDVLNVKEIIGHKGVGRTTSPSILALVAIQSRKYKNKLAHGARDYIVAHVRPDQVKSDFAWALKDDATLQHWIKNAREWLSEAHNKKSGRVSAINSFLTHLIDYPAVPRNPLEYLARATVLPVSYYNEDPNVQKTMIDFLEWIIDRQCSELEEDGHRYISPGFRNPLKKPIYKTKPRQSVRNAMPTRYIQMLIEILTEYNWAWAKSQVPRGRQVGDYIVYYEKGRPKLEWCPVRAVLLFVKLRMPLRTFQVRFLDSGEADEFAINRERGWVKNEHPSAANRIVPVQRGVVQNAFDRRTGENTLFLRISTNKTADQGKEQDQAGYDCPWAPTDVVEALVALRDWQLKWNPIVRPALWSEVRELKRVKTEAQLKGRENAFLFRDPCDRDPHHPILSGRVAGYWHALLTELQKRLQSLGETNHDGSPISLFGRNDRGAITDCVYDLHGLRVSLITAFAEQGVPIEILVKIVGHATYIMTLYYAKFGINHITEVMNDANQRLQKDEQSNFARHLADRAYTDLAKAAAFNSEFGRWAIDTTHSASWVVRDHGICPVACSKCDVGGQRIGGSLDKPVFEAVPGGPANCVRCRFFVTGPAFMIGLVAFANSLLHRLKEKSGKRCELEAAIERLNARRREAERSGAIFASLAEWERTSSNFDQLTSEVDELALSLHATVQLLKQCHVISHKPHGNDSDGSYALVTKSMEALETALEETTDFELVDAVCQSAEFYESVDAGSANYKRMRYFDRMLRANNLKCLFLDIDPHTALIAGNQLTRFLINRVGRSGALSIVDCGRTLQSFGIDDHEISRAVAGEASGRRVSRKKSSSTPGITQEGARR